MENKIKILMTDMNLEEIDEDKIKAGIEGLFGVLRKAIQPIFDKTVEWIGFMLNYLREQYEKEGYPYGPTNEDMWEYYNDISELEQLKYRLEEEIAHKEGIIEMKKRLRQEKS